MGGEVDEAARFLVGLLAESSVALGAADAHLFPRRAVGVGGFVVIFSEVGHVAPSALGIPSHATSSPVPPVGFGAWITREYVEPFFFGGIPSGVGCLPAAMIGCDEVLDEGLDASDHSHLVLVPVGGDGKLSALVGEGPIFVGSGEGFLGKGLGVESEVKEAICLAVMGGLPVVVDVLVAFHAACREGVLSRHFLEGGFEGGFIGGGGGERLFFITGAKERSDEESPDGRKKSASKFVGAGGQRFHWKPLKGWRKIGGVVFIE